MADYRKAPNEAWFFIFTLLKLKYEIFSIIFLSEKPHFCKQKTSDCKYA